jgi:hypothetical protein
VSAPATAEWQSGADGWLYRQQQWGEPSDFGHAYAFVSRGVIHARGAGIDAVERACGAADVRQALAV